MFTFTLFVDTHSYRYIAKPETRRVIKPSFTYVVQIGNQNNYYLFMEGDTAKEVPKDVSTFKTTRLREEEQVLCSYTAIEVAIYRIALYFRGA